MALPPIFNSFETDEPFSSCLTCDRALADLDVPHTVSKIYKGAEVVMEYAMCHPCRMSLSEDFSEESRTAIHNFFNQHVRLTERSLALEGSESHTDWMRSCLTCGTIASEVSDYSIAALAFGEQMLFDPFPMMVCSHCEQTIQKQLSKETRDRWDRFIGENFDTPPSGALQPDGGVPVLI